MVDQPKEPEPPESIKWFRWATHHLRKEWPVIKGAWHTFVFISFVLVSVAVAATIGLEQWHFSGLIATLESKDKYLTRQLDDYHQAFPGRSPSEVAGELTSLRTDVAGLNSRLAKLAGPDRIRHLTDDERRRLKEAFTPIAHDLPAVLIAAIRDQQAEAIRYAREFLSVLKEVGINAAGPIESFATEKEEVGVMVSLIDVDHPSHQASLFIEALRKAGFSVLIDKWETDLNAGIDFELFIGPPS